LSRKKKISKLNSILRDNKMQRDIPVQKNGKQDDLYRKRPREMATLSTRD